MFFGILIFSFTDGSDGVSSRSSAVFFDGIRLCFNVCEFDGEDCLDRTCDIKIGSSHIDGIISSGPDINDPDVSIVFESSSLFVSDCCRGSGLFVSVPSFCRSFSGSDGNDGTTQDSPRIVLSWGRDRVVDMGRCVSVFWIEESQRVGWLPYQRWEGWNEMINTPSTYQVLCWRATANTTTARAPNLIRFLFQFSRHYCGTFMKIASRIQ